MNNDALLFEVMELIKAYETGLTKSYKREPTDSNIDIGYLGPLTMMQSILEAQVKSGEAHLEVTQGALVTNEIINKPEEIESKLFQACSTIYDSNEKKTNDFFAFETKSSFKPEQKEAFYKARLTNKWQAKAKFEGLEELINAKIGEDGKVTLGGKDFNFGIKKCFNCFVEINLDLILPPIEFALDLSKLLNLMSGLLDQIEEDLDPTKLYNLICQFAFRFGENLLCPANLIGLSLILPSLFVKYSLDLLNFKIDATIAFGPIIKAAVSFIASLVENIPRLIFPIIDCFINTFQTIEGAIQSIIDSAQKIAVEGVLSPIERVANKISDIVNDPKGYRIKEEQLEKIKEELKTFSTLEERSEVENSFYKLLFSLISQYPEIENFEEFKVIIEALNPVLLEKYLIVNSGKDDLKKQKTRLEKELVDYNKRDFKVDVELFKENEQKKAILNSGINSFNAKFKVADTNLSASTKMEYSISDWLSRKFGVSYYDQARAENEFDFTSSINTGIDDFQKSINAFFQKIISFLNQIKNTINQFVGGIIGLMKAFELFISEHLAADIKILGDIRELLHIIRLIRLIIMLFDKGLSGCDKIKENKTLFKDILESLNLGVVVDNISRNDIVNYDNINPEDYLVISTTDNMQRNVINLNDCGEAMSALGNKDLDFDSIYDSIRRNAIV